MVAIETAEETVLGSKLNRIKIALALLLLLLGAASVAIPLLVRGMTEAVERTMRHELAWMGQHARTELDEALRLVSRIDSDSDAGGIDAARLGIDIFYSRVNSWHAGRFGAFVQESPERMATLARIQRLLPEVGAASDALLTPEGRRAAINFLNWMIEPVRELSAASYVRYTLNMQRSGESLRFYLRAQIFLVVGLLLCSILLIALLAAQNRRVAESRNRQQEIANENAFLATHDTLTGLSNRTRFMDEFETRFAQATMERGCCLLAIDLDGFKPINDVLGHKAGDQLLVAIADRLRAIAEGVEGGIAARFGGDEFLLLFKGVSNHEAAEAFAERVREELRKPILLDGHRASVDATIGFALSGHEVTSPDELINRADLALNVGKSCGKGVVRCFHQAMLDDAARRRDIEAELMDADIEKEFEPFYQPVLDLPTGRIVGFEALARWRHPRRGLVPPGDFIPIAESSGRIVDIGAAIMRKACRDASQWPRDLTVAVNLSAVQLMRADVPALVWAALSESGLSASRLKLEFTESVMIHDARGTKILMSELRDLGVRVALDDFGTGFSSLSYLRKFPFDELKIDRSFVMDIEADRQAAEVVQTILALARSLDMDVVAEGIENGAQVALLQAMGCGKGQGYCFGAPAPQADALRLVANMAQLRRNAAA